MSACALFLVVPFAIADDVSDEIAEMRVLVEQLQGQVEAQSEQIEHQGEVIRSARLEQAHQSDSRFGASGLTAFLQRLQVEGHVSASYFWNFNQPGPATAIGGPGVIAGFPVTGGNQGLSGNTYPFHSNHNSFQVDQIWFGLEHPVDAENRAGFRFDLVYGTTACNLGNALPIRCGLPGVAGFAAIGDNTSQYYVNQAYVQYLAPITSNGILIKAGKWNTLVGAETANTTANFNITRGNVYTMLQPIDHVGVLASTEFGETGISATIGVMNDDTNGFFGTGADPDRNEAKSLVAQLGWSGETLAATSTVLWGPSLVFSDKHASGLWDLVVTWDPNEKISAWVNLDYSWNKAVGNNTHAWGIATAGRYAVTERMGISGRFEYVNDEDGHSGWINTGPGPLVVDASIYSITGTFDYALTSNLMVRAEVRYDNITKDANDNEFFDKGGDFRPDQTTAGAEIVYTF
jgi:hypothetical protein